jgi:hypothetical protein
MPPSHVWKFVEKGGHREKLVAVREEPITLSKI